jgi:hypothetical protein
MASADESKDKGQHAGAMNRRVDAIGPTDSWEAASILPFDRRSGPPTDDAPPGRGPGRMTGTTDRARRPGFALCRGRTVRLAARVHLAHMVGFGVFEKTPPSTPSAPHEGE